MNKDDCEYVYVRNHPQHLEFGRLCAGHESAAYPKWVGQSRSQLFRNLCSLLLSVGKPRRKVFILEAPGAVTAVLLRRAPGCRILMINADPTLMNLEKAKGFKRRLGLFLLSRVDVFLSPAHLMLDLARRLLPDKRHRIFHMYVETDRWKPLPPEKRSEDFLYIGRADRFKNQELLIRAFHAIKARHGLDIKLNVIGYIHPDYEPVLRPLLDDSIHFTGWRQKPWEDVPPSGYYFNLALLEPSGTNILEALALGLAPIVSTGCGYAADVVAQLDPRLVVAPVLSQVVAAWEYLHGLPPQAGAELRERCVALAREWNRERAHAAFKAACAEP